MALAPAHAWALLLPLLLAQPEGAPARDTHSWLGVDVLCDDGRSIDGALDEEWHLVLQVEVPDKERPVRMQQEIPSLSSAEDIRAALIALMETNQIPAKRGDLPSLGADHEPSMRWIELPDGYAFRSVRTERRTEDGWEATDEQLRTSMRCEGERAHSGAPPGALRHFTLELREFSGTNLTFELELTGNDAFGGRMRTHQVFQYPLRSAPERVMVGIGDVLERMGMRVVFPTDSKLRATFAEDGPQFSEIRFAARQTSDLSAPDRYAVEFTLLAN